MSPSARLNYATRVTKFTKAELADRAGVEASFIDRLVSVGFVRPDPDGRFVAADARRAQLAQSLEDEAGIALDDLTDSIKQGWVSLDFMEATASESTGLDYRDIGLVDLKGVGDPLRLYLARLPE
jgi:hypothetical protein